MINLAEAIGSLRRHGPTLGAVADFVIRSRGNEMVLIDAQGPVTGTDLGRLMSSVRPGGRPGLITVPGRPDRFTVAALLAATAAGWDAVVVDPKVSTDSTGEDSTGAAPRGRLWLSTTGTTGVPHQHARRRYGPRLVLPVRQVWRTWGLGRRGAMLVEPPLHHGHGLGFTLLGLVSGHTVLLPAGADHRDELLVRHRPRLTVSVPTQLARLRPQAGWRPRVMLTGSGPLSPELQAAVTGRFGSVLHNLFGSTEAGFATMATPTDLAASPGCVGRPLAGVRLRVVDGLVEVDSPFATVPGGWIATGDRGGFDEHGLLRLLGRADDVIVVNGKNLTREEIRRVVLLHPDVLEAHVTAEPDPVSGHRVTVRVRPSFTDTVITTADLERWVRERTGVAVTVTGATPPGWTPGA